MVKISKMILGVGFVFAFWILLIGVLLVMTVRALILALFWKKDFLRWSLIDNLMELQERVGEWVVS